MRRCGATGCPKRAPERQPLCANHWSRIPWPVRQRVYEAEALVWQARGATRHAAQLALFAAQQAAISAVGVPG